MKLTALMPCRNEDWCLGMSARVALTWADELCILNHASTDETLDIIAEVSREHPGRVHLISTPELQWSEMQHRQMLLEAARDRGATHIAIVDADEILTANLIEFARTGIGTAAARGLVELPGYNLRASLNRYHLNGTWGRRHFAFAFEDDPRLHWFEKGRTAEQFHKRVPDGPLETRNPSPIPQGHGGIVHLWGVSDRRLRAKHALYKVTERLRWPDKPVQTIDAMYSWWKTGIKAEEPGNWQFAYVPDAAWWGPYEEWLKHLHIAREPWQEQAVRELVAKHHPETFRGLDLFGVA
jgi:hypothetical protein